MPLNYDETMYQALYNVGAPDGARIHYTRELYDLNQSWVARRLDMLPAGLITSANVLVVGCGFGWLMEHLLDAGAASVTGVDPSPYVQANKADHSRADVAPRIVSATVGVDNVSSVLQAVGFARTYSVVIDDDAASSNSDVELTAFLNGCESLLQGNQKSRIIHLVTPQQFGSVQSPFLNWKPMADWKALRSTHTWVDIHTGQVV